MSDLTDAVERVRRYLDARDASPHIRDGLPTIAYVESTDFACGSEIGLLAADLRAVVAAHPTGPDQDQPAAWADLRRLAHVPHGPDGVDPDEADQAYLAEAAKRVESGVLGHGSNVTATVAGLLRGIIPALVRAREAQATAPAADEDDYDIRAAFNDLNFLVRADDDEAPLTRLHVTRALRDRLNRGWRLVPPAAAPGAETTTDEDAQQDGAHA